MNGRQQANTLMAIAEGNANSNKKINNDSLATTVLRGSRPNSTDWKGKKNIVKDSTDKWRI